jgi:hypothetical protein
MSGKAKKRGKAKKQMARALARWEGEGGAPKLKPVKNREVRAALAKEEEHILRCLGAAVIMQWNDLPTQIQRALFDYAVSRGDPRQVVELKGRIARFLHKHKNMERDAD